MLRTRFTDLIGCSVPIQMAPVEAWLQLAAAVSEAGGLGTVPVYGYPAAVIADMLDVLRRQTTKPIGANFVMRFVKPAEAEECIAAAARRVRVVDFFYSDPDPALVEIVHREGALASWQVGSREEAVAAVEAGCDFIIAQGIEAGGHVRGHLGLLAVLSEVLEAVDVPVLAAGGIGSGRAMAAALAAGADGVRVGTRFLAAQEAETHPTYVSALIAARPQDTVYTEAFWVGWPDAPHRVLRSCLQTADAFEGEIVGEGETETGERFPLQRYQSGVPDRRMTGAVEAMSLWAGESVGEVRRVEPAATIVHDLAGEAERLLQRWA